MNPFQLWGRPRLGVLAQKSETRGDVCQRISDLARPSTGLCQKPMVERQPKFGPGHLQCVETLSQPCQSGRCIPASACCPSSQDVCHRQVVDESVFSANLRCLVGSRQGDVALPLVNAKHRRVVQGDAQGERVRELARECNRFIALYFGIVVGLLVAASVFIYEARIVVHDGLRDEEAVALLTEANDVLHDLESAESGQRGYLLTGNADYLLPYYKSANYLSGTMLRLQRVAAGDARSREIVRRVEQVEAAKKDLGDLIYRRAKHVVTEIARTTQAAALLNKRRYEQFGDLMAASHASLRDDYEVSCKELDFLAEEAVKPAQIALRTADSCGGN